MDVAIHVLVKDYRQIGLNGSMPAINFMHDFHHVDMLITSYNTHATVCVEMNRKQTFWLCYCPVKNSTAKEKEIGFRIFSGGVQNWGSMDCFGSFTMEIINLSKAVFGSSSQFDHILLW